MYNVLANAAQQEILQFFILEAGLDADADASISKEELSAAVDKDDGLIGLVGILLTASCSWVIKSDRKDWIFRHKHPRGKVVNKTSGGFRGERRMMI